MSSKTALRIVAVVLMLVVLVLVVLYLINTSGDVTGELQTPNAFSSRAISR